MRLVGSGGSSYHCALEIAPFVRTGTDPVDFRHKRSHSEFERAIVPVTIRRPEFLAADLPDEPIIDRHEARGRAIANDRRTALPWILLPGGLALLAGLAWCYGPVGDEPAALADLVILCAASIPIVLGSLFLIADVLKTNFGTFSSAALNLSAFLAFTVGGYLWLIHLLSPNGFLLAVAVLSFGLASVLIFSKLFDLSPVVGLPAFLIIAAVETGLVILLDWQFSLTLL